MPTKCLNRRKMLTHYRCTDPYPVCLISSSGHRSWVTLMDRYQRHQQNPRPATIAMTAFWSFLLWPLQASRDAHAPVAQPRLFRPEYALMDRDSGMKITRNKKNEKKRMNKML